MKVSEFDYFLPQELIAQFPLEKREKSRMMVLYKNEQKIEHRIFEEIVELLDDRYILVLNDTKVIPARLTGRKETGANVEIFLIKEKEKNTWVCLARPAKRLKLNAKILFPYGLSAVVVDVMKNGKRLIKFVSEEDTKDLIFKIGKIPLPPYIKRKPNEQDTHRYQTVFARKEGSVAAPTAGLHFTKEILQKLKEKGVVIKYITLHVGPGTFKPVKTENIEDHKMDSEYYEISADTAEAINRAKSEGKKVIACGTTVTRALESAASGNNMLKPKSEWTSLFIYPGYKFKIVDALITNFHLPKSTLIMLVCAFAGKDFVMRAYNEAVKLRYRFYSYGDCMFIL